MNRSPKTVYQRYTIEANARGGRYTRGCLKSSKAMAPSMGPQGTVFDPYGREVSRPDTPDGTWWCATGPLLRGDLNVEVDGWDVRAVYAPRDSEDFHLFAFNTNGNASTDDILAWAFAAKWWINYCWKLHDEAVKVAPTIGKKWPKSGPDDAVFAPSRIIVDDGFMPGPGNAQENYIFYLGGQQFLKGMAVMDGSWSSYMNSLTAQVVAKAISHNVVDLILIQITVKHCALFFKSCLKPTADQDLMTLLNPTARLS